MMEGVCLIAKKGTKKNKKDNTPLQKSLDIEKQVSKNMKLDFLEKIKLLEMPLRFKVEGLNIRRESILVEYIYIWNLLNLF